MDANGALIFTRGYLMMCAVPDKKKSQRHPLLSFSSRSSRAQKHGHQRNFRQSNRVARYAPTGARMIWCHTFAATGRAVEPTPLRTSSFSCALQHHYHYPVVHRKMKPADPKMAKRLWEKWQNNIKQVGIVAKQPCKLTSSLLKYYWLLQCQ